MANRQPTCGGVRRHRLRGLAHAAAGAAWRLCVDSQHLMLIGKPVKRRNGESRTSHEDDPPTSHGWPLVAAIDLAKLFQGAPDDHVAFQPRDMVDEQHPVQMVDLMLHAGGK